MSEAKSLASFWYQWSEGHQGRFNLAVARFDDEERQIPGVVMLNAWIQDDALHYNILDADTTPWAAFKAFGPVASREDALSDGDRVFALVDAIMANDQRLSAKVLASGVRH